MNKDKSGLFFSKNTQSSTRDNITRKVEIRITNSFEKYLGLPTIIGRSRNKVFKDIIDKVRSKINNWKFKFLSQAGREIMLKAVIQVIPTYSM